MNPGKTGCTLSAQLFASRRGGGGVETMQNLLKWAGKEDFIIWNKKLKMYIFCSNESR